MKKPWVIQEGGRLIIESFITFMNNDAQSNNQRTMALRLSFFIIFYIFAHFEPFSMLNFENPKLSVKKVSQNMQKEVEYDEKCAKNCAKIISMLILTLASGVEQSVKSILDNLGFFRRLMSKVLRFFRPRSKRSTQSQIKQGAVLSLTTPKSAVLAFSHSLRRKEGWPGPGGTPKKLSVHHHQNGFTWLDAILVKHWTFN